MFLHVACIYVVLMEKDWHQTCMKATRQDHTCRERFLVISN